MSLRKKVFLFGVILACIFPTFSWIRTEYREILSVFGLNPRKCGKNADQNNSKYGHFLHSVYRRDLHLIIPL